MIQLSVIVPIYNVEKYIAKCLNSVLSNDLTQDEYEILVIDDGSPDNSVEIAKGIAERNSHIKIISQNNKGLGGARNTGIANAVGKYLLFLDADDWINENMLRMVISKASESNLDVLEFGAIGVLPEGGSTYKISMSTDGKVYNGIDYVNKLSYMWSACNKLYNTRFLQDNQLYFTEHIYYEDLEFFTRMIPKANRMEAIPDIVASFYQSSDSITRNTSKEKKLKSYRDIVSITEKLEGEYKKYKPENNPNKDNFYLQYLGTLVVTLFYQFIRNKEKPGLIDQYYSELKNKGLLYIDAKISPSHKNLFRIIFLKHFNLFRMLTFFNLKLR